MKLLLLVGGHTERMALPSFFKRWLDPQLPRPIGIKTVRFEGWRDYYDEIRKKVRAALPGRCAQPETVNFDEPPAKLLERLHRDKLGRSYKKITDGANLFDRLDPAVACGKCPYLKGLLDDMLSLARAVEP